jgi:excinuclease ABC subunit A
MAAMEVSPKKIVIRGAREHNLRNVDLEIPRDRLVVFTGVSGSGKSSLAFDTLYAEGQRRYVESLSSYARQFLGQMEKPDVDFIGGLSPAISIEQKSAGSNPRSTVGTITEVYDYLRVLFARVGRQHCYRCGRAVGRQTVSQMVDSLMALGAGAKLTVLAPLIRERKGEHKDVLERVRQQGYVRVRHNGTMYRLEELPALKKTHKHNLEAVVDRVVVKEGAERRLADSLEAALKLGEGLAVVAHEAAANEKAAPRGKAAAKGKAGKGKAALDSQLATRHSQLATRNSFEDILFSEHNACPVCSISFEPLAPQMFSFNSPQGSCKPCAGLGTKLEVDPALVVTDERLCLSDGAIAIWKSLDAGSSWTGQVVRELGKTYKFTLETPWREIPEEARQILLFGSGGKRFAVKWQGKHTQGTFQARIEGVIPKIGRFYHSSTSEKVREQCAELMSSQPCEECGGTRLRPEASAVRVSGRSLPEVAALSIAEALGFFSNLELGAEQQKIAGDVLKEIRGRLGFLRDVGLHYLTLERRAPSLSGGEAQRIRLASQIGCGLTGVLYILDEPSIGLHQRDNRKLLGTLVQLRDLGNTVVVVEHDTETIEAADHVVDFGPGAGHRGGTIVAEGTPGEIAQSRRSLTGQYLSGKRRIPQPDVRKAPQGFIEVLGAAENNLQGVDVRFPVGVLTCVTGVSGSGKSSLVNAILYNALASSLNGAHLRPGKHREVRGLGLVDKVIGIDQKPIGRTPRSNPATYVKMFDEIRDFFSRLPLSRMRGYKAGRFSFNVKGGRCEACGGDGMKKIEMHFLADVYVTCEVCKGRRFNRETLDVQYQGKSIADVLDLEVEEALELFSSHPKLKRSLATLHEVGLDYLKLGQPAPTLSGGEAQRVKLARELSRASTGKTVYILDEPTTGLHFADVEKLLLVLRRLVGYGNTVIVIEHNLDVIAAADYTIDLGPEGGAGGGRIVAEGTPEEVAAVPESHTGQFLAKLLRS